MLKRLVEGHGCRKGPTRKREQEPAVVRKWERRRRRRVATQPHVRCMRIKISVSCSAAHARRWVPPPGCGHLSSPSLLSLASSSPLSGARTFPPSFPDQYQSDFHRYELAAIGRPYSLTTAPSLSRRVAKSVPALYGPSYSSWLATHGLKSRRVSEELVSFGGESKKRFLFEDEFLKQQVPVLCLVLSKGRGKARAVKETWGMFLQVVLKLENHNFFFGRPSLQSCFVLRKLRRQINSCAKIFVNGTIACFFLQDFGDNLCEYESQRFQVATDQ